MYLISAIFVRACRTAIAEFEATGENSDPNGSEIKPDVAKLKAGVSKGALPKQLAANEDDYGSAVIDADEVNPRCARTKASENAGAGYEQLDADDLNNFLADESEHEDGDDDDDDEDDPRDVDAGYQAESGNAGEDMEEDFDTNPDQVDGILLQPMNDVVLSENRAAAIGYLDKAMIGFSCFLQDMSFDCAIYAAKKLSPKLCVLLRCCCTSCTTERHTCVRVLSICVCLQKEETKQKKQKKSREICS